MINRMVTGISTAILGALIACVPNFIWPIGEHCREMMMGCVSAAKTEYGIGVLIVFLAILLGFAESREIRTGISIGLGFIGILAALVATVLVGFCDGSCAQCACNPMAAPVMAALGIAVALISFINAIYLSRMKRK
ncbi:MAG TPA: DUF4418 family protein [Anaerovoracaceae bacterium]|nr:DUF4418 family protein [Anaerovoracaceae bacterium]